MYLYAVFVFVFVIWQFKQLIFDKNRHSNDENGNIYLYI
jgi:hypothetical protein